MIATANPLRSLIDALPPLDAAAGCWRSGRGSFPGPITPCFEGAMRSPSWIWSLAGELPERGADPPECLIGIVEDWMRAT